MDRISLLDIEGSEIGVISDGRVWAGTGQAAREVGRVEEGGGVVGGVGANDRFLGSAENDGRIWAGQRGFPQATVGFVEPDGTVRRGRDRQSASVAGSVRPSSPSAAAALLLLVAHEAPEEFPSDAELKRAGDAFGTALGAALGRAVSALIQRGRRGSESGRRVSVGPVDPRDPPPEDPEEIFRLIRALVGTRPVDGDAGLRRAYLDGILDLHELQAILAKYETTHYLIEHGLWRP